LVKKSKSEQIMDAIPLNEDVPNVSLPEALTPFLDSHTESELQELLGVQVAKLENKVPAASLEEFAIAAVINEMRKEKKHAEFLKQPKKEATQFVGFIMGDGGTWDKIANMISAAQSYVKKHSIGEAIANGYINGDGAILDTRAKIFGKPNGNYGKPLKEKVTDASRTMYLIGRLGEDQTFKYGTITTNDAALCRGWSSASAHQYMPCTTFGIVKENTKDTFKLNASLAEDTTSVFKAINEDMDCGKIFMDVVTPQITEILNVERMYELTKEAWDRLMFVRGRVSWIARDRESYFHTIKMGIMDASGNELVVELPEQVSKDYGELSDIIVIGKPDRSDLKVVDESTGKATYEKGKGPVILKAVGVYVVKATPTDVFSAEGEGEVKNIEGWVS